MNDERMNELKSMKREMEDWSKACDGDGGLLILNVVDDELTIHSLPSVQAEIDEMEEKHDLP